MAKRRHHQKIRRSLGANENPSLSFSAALCRGLIEGRAPSAISSSRLLVFRGFVPRPHQNVANEEVMADMTARLPQLY